MQDSGGGLCDLVEDDTVDVRETKTGPVIRERPHLRYVVDDIQYDWLIAPGPT